MIRSAFSDSVQAGFRLHRQETRPVKAPSVWRRTHAQPDWAYDGPLDFWRLDGAQFG